MESTTLPDKDDEDELTIEEEFPPPVETTVRMNGESDEASSEEPSTEQSENSSTSQRQNSSEKRTKVSRVIFKRPIFSKAPETTTDSMVTISRADETESGFSLKALQAGFIEIVANAIIFWKTSLMLLLIVILIASLSYYRRRIVRLKAEIIQKNLGSSYSQSCSYPHSSNAYTPTYFPRRSEKLACQFESDYGSSTTSRSFLYANTYNSSHHSYETIDGLGGEHIYAEIPGRREFTDDESCGKPSHYETRSTTTSEFSPF